MITDIDQVMDISVSALKLLGRTESTIKEYQQRFSVIAKISNRFHDESTDLIEFLEKYDQLTLSYLQGIHASARVIRGHKRAIRLLRIAAKSQNIALVAEEFKHALEPSKYETLSVSVIESLEKFKVPSKKFDTTTSTDSRNELWHLEHLQ